jgi:fatty acid desaturase
MATNTDGVMAALARQKDAAELRRKYAQTFPRYLQQVITWVTDKALPGQTPSRFVTTPFLNVILALLQWPASVLGAFFLFRLNPVVGIVCTPLSWVLSVNSLRRLQVSIGHHAVHQEILRSRRMNYLIQAVASTGSRSAGSTLAPK